MCYVSSHAAFFTVPTHQRWCSSWFSSMNPQTSEFFLSTTTVSFQILATSFHKRHLHSVEVTASYSKPQKYTAQKCRGLQKLAGPLFVSRHSPALQTFWAASSGWLVQLQMCSDQEYTQLTPWSRVLPEKLTVPKLLKKFPAFYGTRSFVTAFTTASHLPLLWARSIQSMHSSHSS